MASYPDVYDMQENATYRKQVTIACRTAAFDIVNESGDHPNHTNRVIWAKAILSFNVHSQERIDRMAAAVTGNPTIQQTAPNGPWSDGDIQFVVNSLVDIHANAQ